MSRNTRAFKELEQLWYSRLAREGFSDIEDTKDQIRFLKVWESYRFCNIDPMIIEQTKLYYSEAANLLSSYPFKNKTHRRIWELHCEGLTVVEIESRIRKYRRAMIHNIITEIAARIKR